MILLILYRCQKEHSLYESAKQCTCAELPKEPVPPVIRNVLFLNIDLFFDIYSIDLSFRYKDSDNPYICHPYRII